jgi:hypothetical protein
MIGKTVQLPEPVTRHPVPTRQGTIAVTIAYTEASRSSLSAPARPVAPVSVRNVEPDWSITVTVTEAPTTAPR